MVVFMQEHVLHGQVLLVVGDEPMFVLGLEECLEAAGAQVSQASLQDSPRFVQQGQLTRRLTIRLIFLVGRGLLWPAEAGRVSIVII